MTRKPTWRRWRIAARIVAVLAVATGSTAGLASCGLAAPIAVTRDNGKPVILLGYQCDSKPAGVLQKLSVGRKNGRSPGPTVWAIKADRATPQHEVRPGTVPDGYEATTDDLHGGDLGDTFWVLASFAGNDYSGVDFDLSKLKKDGQVLNSSGGLTTREAFDKQYACSS